MLKLKLMLAWLFTQDSAAAEKSTLEALDAGRDAAILKWAARRAAELGVEPPTLAVTGDVPSVEDKPDDEPEKPARKKATR